MLAENKIASNIVELNLSLQEKETEIELIQQTFTEIGSELNLDKVFQIVSERARLLINAETLLIPLLDDNNETYTYRGGSGKNADEIVGESLPLEYGLCGWVWKHKKPWWKGMLDKLSDDEKNRWQKDVGNTILVPLQGKRQFLGGIVGLNKTDGSSFDKNDLNLLQLFAGIVSIAIENAMSVKKMEESRELNEDYRIKLEKLNRQLVDSSKELEYLSLYDSITALPNRSLFYDRLSRDLSFAENTSSQISILLVDVDNFKNVNEALGHDGGDDLLSKIARRFEGEIKNHETLARLGGDEYIIVLPACGQEEAIRRAELVLDSLKNEFNIHKNNVVVNATIGISIYPEHGDTISNLLSHADFAMHEAKNNKLNVSMYNPDNDYMAQGRLALVTAVHKALDEKRFELYYQPKISAESGRVVAAEALGRWYSEKHGNVPPDIFIGVLEQNGLIDEYTFWAIETAMAQAREWRSVCSEMRIAVNLSPQTLMHPDFKNNIDKVIRNKKDGELLTFEITENLFLSEFERLTEILEYICGLGVELSIDDYGTGYSSLSRLRRLPVSELKIDQSFIKDMVSNKDDEVIVHSTIELAHNLGLRVVAEGVEEQSALDLLKKLGCDIIQGYLISRPVHSSKFDEFIKGK
ncbi:MAG: EAL domain-containing protein [Gammaproteobacteria bacterium]|nr:EAL domain-containing protein [Gammaproteobacteria bacterium]